MTITKQHFMEADYKPRVLPDGDEADPGFIAVAREKVGTGKTFSNPDGGFVCMKSLGCPEWQFFIAYACLILPLSKHKS